jgi:PIN domain nuclease of toxin-antitoxin system
MAKELTYVLDACALLALIKKEKGYQKVDQLLQECVHGEIVLYLNSVNLLEVYYDRLYVGRDKAEEDYVLIYNSNIQVIDDITLILREAARFKTSYKKMSLADAVGLATAICLDAVFVTCDHHELEKVEQSESVLFLWVR